MPLDWGDFSVDSGIEDIPLLISLRTQSLLLSALTSIHRRYNWLEVDDATWDDIDGAISQATHEVMEAVLTDNFPVGAIVAWAGVISTIPDGWHICDGHLLSVDDYPELREALDIPFDDNEFLTVPDLRDRFIYGMGTGSTLGGTGGAATVALAVNELPAHTHTIPSADGTGGGVRAARGSGVSISTIPSSSVGSGAAHQNLPPYMRLYYIMKVSP